MPEKLTPAQFHDSTNLPDWRVVRGAKIEASYRASDFAAATEFVSQVAAAADAAQHHPDVDLRYPSRVRLVLTTHAADGLTDLDVQLAGAISQLASAAGLSAEPLTAAVVEVAIDVMDMDAVRPFWKAVLDYVDEPPSDINDQIDAIVDPLRIGPSFWFQQMDEPRPQRNRIHLDVLVPHDRAEARIAAALDAGGRLVSDAEAKAFWVLADPEGNEVCICTWQDRD